jgi:hypothetical protein
MLKLSQDHRGHFIVSKINSKGQRPIRVIFPPHAKHLATQALERAILFLAEVNRNPTTSVLTSIIIGRQVTPYRTSPASRPKRAKRKRVPRGTSRAKRDDLSSAPQGQITGPIIPIMSPVLDPLGSEGTGGGGGARPPAARRRDRS